MSSVSPHLSFIKINPVRLPQPSERAERDGNAGSAVRFGGVGDSVSAFIGLIDRNRAAELVSSDGLGMLVPRTGVAAAFRGADDARETLIREGAGLFCVALLAGLSNQLMVYLLGNRVGFYNPHGTPGKAWIGARNLRAFSQLYDQALETHGSASEARQGFIRSVLDGLESGDRQLSLKTRLATLQAMLNKAPHASHHRETAEKALRQMMQEGAVTGLPVKMLYPLLKAGELARLEKAFLDAGWGRLTPKGKQDLAGWFAQKAPGSTSVRGTVAFDSIAWQAVRKTGKGLPEHALHSAFLSQRLKLALRNLQDSDAKFMQAVDQAALDHGLTSEVRLQAGGKTLLSGQSRKTLLREMKYFLEHYVDRAAYEVNRGKGWASHLGFGPSWKAQREMLRQTLFARQAKGLGRFFPQVNDGLVSAAMKAKSGYTWVPVAVAILANGLTTFLNNYVTQWKYGGKVFFPGEEVFLSKSNQPKTNLAKPNPAGFAPLSPMAHSQANAWNGRLV